MSTPLMQQYFKIKENYQDCLLFFHLGDFYEMFDDDAIFLSDLIGLTLTKRGEHPMCGIPVANLDFYIKKIFQNSIKKIAICEQAETPDEAKLLGNSLVRREVKKIITPGTYTDINNPENNFILSVIDLEDQFLLTYGDIGTGECFREIIKAEMLISYIFKINPSEIILNKNYEILNIFEEICVIISKNPIYDFEELDAKEKEGISLIINYVKQNGFAFHPNLEKRNNNIYAKLSTNTIRNLEIINDLSGNAKNSLFNVLNRTQTPMGRRLLKSFLLRPLIDEKIITDRLNCIDYFLNNSYKINLKSGDLNKILNNLKTHNDIFKLLEILKLYWNVIQDLEDLPTYLKNMVNSIGPMNIINILSEYIDENNFIDLEHNKLNEEKDGILKTMFLLPNKYQLNCKIKNNSLIGYFFEFTKPQDVPKDFILKQGLVSSSRYTNSELMSLEIKLKEIEATMELREKEIFKNIISQINNFKIEIEKLSKFIAHIDYFYSCSKVAKEKKYTRPIFIKENKCEMQKARHPIMELYKEIFICNSLNLSEEKSVILLTGPNMGGKSTFLRQTALICLMAQVGMYVPASHMHSKIFDGIFVRIGAGDNIFKNESTFMTEMNELSEILSSSTSNSLIILDEIGRGTSTIDGMSISFAVLEYIIKDLNCFALLSTHYHELSHMEEKFTKVTNYQTSHSFKINGDILFLYKIELGVANKSFGIDVAKMSNLPTKIICRSRDIFNNINIDVNFNFN